MPRKGNSHTLCNHSLHNGLACCHDIRLGGVNNDGARVLKHDSVEGTFVALIMDLDVFGVLPVNIDVMIVDSSDLFGDDIFGFFSVHLEGVVDDHPSEHVEGSCVPTF